MSKTAALILAAGKGTRMHSDKPKVLQTLLHEPMLAYVIKAMQSFFAEHVWTVVGHKAPMIYELFSEKKSKFIEQTEQFGTGHALQVAVPTLIKQGYEYVVVINGDVPLIDAKAMQFFLQQARGQELAFATLTLDNAGSYGRVVRKDGQVQAIVEAKDYDEKIHGPESGEVNAGLYCINLNTAQKFLPLINCTNNSAEYYITDLVGLLFEAGIKVQGIECGNNINLLGVNSPLELVQAEEILRKSIVDAALERGVIIHAPQLVRIGPEVQIEAGAEVFGPCEIYGKSHVARGATIHSHTVIINSHIGSGAKILSFSHMEEAVIGCCATLGPYGRLRPGANLQEYSKVGNFVEVKKSTIGKAAKVSHLSYIGDATVGDEANIGAGTITCNYDGVNKHKTHVGQKAFIGSNTALVAPVTIGDGALVGAGSVITKNVPEEHLGISRSNQKNLILRGRMPKE